MLIRPFSHSVKPVQGLRLDSPLLKEVVECGISIVTMFCRVFELQLTIGVDVATWHLLKKCDKYLNLSKE